MKKRVDILLLYANSADNATLSYQHAWPRHFQAHPRFGCIPVNLADRRLSARLRAHLLVRTARCDAIVLLHSVFSNACFLQGRLFDAVRGRPQPKAYLIANEYKLMPEKMAFCDALDVSLLISQTRCAAVHDLYRERLGCIVEWIPCAGLDSALFRMEAPRSSRPIDIGYRAADAPPYLGHNERRDLADYFTTHAERLGMTVDISLDPDRRFTEVEWAAFLNHCKGQLGSESGGDYFELTDATRRKVNAYLSERPGATFGEIFERFFKGYPDPIPIRVLSGRNVEAAGTKTVQLLFEGHYDGYYEPDVHYIALKKDFSNIDDVMAKFRDQALCQALTDRAYDVTVNELTYPKLIDRFGDLLAPLL